jgi:transformation/transcription domain-associated protein
MDTFVKNASNSPHFFPVLQSLITNEQVSHQLVGILLKYLMTHMDELGGYTPHQAALTLKLFKMSFLAINTYIAVNEAVLVPHLQKLILRCFECAGQAEDGSIYYQILRALFRWVTKAQQELIL